MHAAVDLFGHRGLLFGGAGNLRVHRVDGADQLRHGVQRRPGFVGLGRGAVPGIAGAAHGLHGGDGAFLQAIDHALDFLGAGLGTTGQGTHFVGDHGKAATGLPRPRRFDRGVKGQQVGLLSNRADHAEHADNRRHVLLQAVEGHAAAADIVHQRMDLRDAAVHHALGGLALGVGLLRSHGSALGAARNLLGSGRHLIDRGGHLVGLVTLTLHGLLRTLRLVGHLAHQPGELRGHFGDLAHQTVDLFDKPVEGPGQIAQFVLAGDSQAPRQVALTGSDVVEVGFHQVQRTQDGIGQDHARRRNHQQHQHSHTEDTQQYALHAFLDLGLDHRHLGIDAIQVDRGAEYHVPLGQVFGVAKLGHQFGLAGLGRAVLQVVSAVLADLDQVAVDVDAIGVAVVLEALAHAVRAVALEQADGFGVVAEEVAILAVAGIGQQLDHLGTRRRIARGGGVVERLDGGHGHFHITLQSGLGGVEQVLAGLIHLVARLPLEDPHRGQADHQRKQQHRHDGQAQDFDLQAQTHGFSLLLVAA